MISVHCPRHGQEVLLGHRQILGIEGRDHDVTVRWACWCGQQGTSRMAGRRSATTTAA